MNKTILTLLCGALASCGGIATSPESDVASSTAPLVAAATAPPPPACGTDTIATNASGAAVILASDTAVGGVNVLEICATTDGVHWTGPTAVGNGQLPTAAIAPNGRAVLVWTYTNETTFVSTMQASILPPGGTWTAPATLATTAGHTMIAMDNSGNAIAMWAPLAPDVDYPVQTASLAATSTTWMPTVTLAPFGSLATLVGNAAGDVVVSWRTRTTNLIQGAAGTILGGFRATVTFAQTNGYVHSPAIPAINSAGDAIVVWEATFGGTGYATMNAAGTWSANTGISTTEVLVTVVINSAGNFVLSWIGTDGGVETITVPA